MVDGSGEDRHGIGRKVIHLNHIAYDCAIKKLLKDPRIRAMEKYAQHGDGNTLAHSLHVARTAGRLASRMRLRVHENELARGAMLHDFYLYSTHDMKMSAYQHGTRHAEQALKNASRHYDLTEIERDIIYSHMWPLNITHVPHCRESVLVTVADKYCAVVEFGRAFSRKMDKQVGRAKKAIMALAR